MIKLKVAEDPVLKLSYDVSFDSYPPYTGSYEIVPTESEQTIQIDGMRAVDDITVGAIDSNYVGSGVTRRDSDDLSASGPTITAPSGYYESAASKAVANGSATTPATTITTTPSISVDSSGEITATVSASESVTPTISEGYVTAGTAGTVTVTGTNTSQLSTQGAKTVTPSESQQTAVASGLFTTGDVVVEAIDSEYVGSDVPRRNQTNITFSGEWVLVDYGYYQYSGAASMPQGIISTKATKGTVSDHSVSVTPSITVSRAGYVDEGSTGKAVTVSASELVSGTKEITENGTDIDVTNYEYVDVSVPGSTINNQNKTVTPTESEQSITADTGYTGLGTVTVGAIDDEYVGSAIEQRDADDLVALAFNVFVPKGYYAAQASKGVTRVEQGVPVATKGNVSNHKVKITPSVLNSTGWITVTPQPPQNPQGIIYGTSVEVTASELVSGTKQITANGTEDVTNYASVDVAVPQPSGTKNITISANGTTTEDVTSYASASITANVPNSYSASDEGKVVDNGALVSQTSDTVTANNTYDTTLINSLTVNVSGSASYDFLSKAQPTGELTTDRTNIGSYTCYQRTGITKVTAPNLTRYYLYSFYGCTSLASIPTANIAYIGDYAFYGCSSLTSLTFPVLTGTTSSTDMRHGSYMFANCTGLTSISLPEVTYWRNKSNLFDGCSSLTSVYMPKCTALAGNNQFKNCTSLPSLVLPSINGGNANHSLGSNFCGGCTSLESFDVGNPYAIDANAFNGASNLTVVVIRKTSRTTSLGNVSAFTGTPFASGGSGGTLYVPQSKLSDYQSASNWSTILGYTNNQIKSIESTATDPDAPLDLTTHYADGSLISGY